VFLSVGVQVGVLHTGLGDSEDNRNPVSGPAGCSSIGTEVVRTVNEFRPTDTAS